MQNSRKNSIDFIGLNNWNWDQFLDDLIYQISIFDIEPYKIADKFLYKKSLTSTSKNPITVTTSTWACKFNKINQIRAA